MPLGRAEGVEDGRVGQVRGRLVRLAYRFLWDWDDAEDAVQDALAIAQQKREQLKDHSRWWSWVRRIVVQQCHLQWRKSGRRQRAESSMPPPAHGDRQPAAMLETAELGRIVRELIAALPERQQTAIVLRHLEQMDYRSIAAEMEISQSTARVHVRAGREVLREAILKRYPQWAGGYE